MTPHTAPGMQYLAGAVDCHVHACPHLNGRSVTVFEAVRQAAAAGMRAVGLMDNFCNSAGYAALANSELGHLGVQVFGGLIMQPTAGGVSAATARAAGAYVEFSFFILTHAVTVELTHVDQEKHKVTGGGITIDDMAERIRAASPARAILSSDCGVFLLPPPVEGFREFLLLVESAGFTPAEIRQMSGTNPAALFRIGDSHLALAA